MTGTQAFPVCKHSGFNLFRSLRFISNWKQALEMVRIYIFCFFLVSFSDLSVAICPAFCECSNGKLFCMNSGLKILLQTRSTKHLSIAGNFEDCLSPAGFWMYTNVTVLDYHQLKSFDENNFGSFYNLTNLRELYLGYNHILTADCTPPSDVNVVNMSQQNGTQTQLKWQEGLYFSGNDMTPAPEPATLQSLTILLSEDCEVDILIKETFKGMPELQKLNLSGSKLSSLPNGIFSSFPSVSHLILDHNLLQEIKEPDFKDKKNLQVLSLSYNQLPLINPSAFKKLHKLEVLKLKGNHIFRIRNFMFQNCPNLREIDLSQNIISTVEELAFSGLSSLTILRLNNNRLVYINPQMFRVSPQLQLLELRGNVWKCDCTSLGLKSWLESGGDSLVTVRCSHPEILKGQYLRAISSSVIHSADSRCGRAQSRVQSKPTHADNSSRVTRQTHHDGDRYHTVRRVGRTVPQLRMKQEGKRKALSLQYQMQPGEVVLAPQNKSKIAAVSAIPTIPTTQEKNTASDACSYNHLVILNISAVTVTSSCALVKWRLANTDFRNIYFRVMYDQFNTHTRFSRFVNVKQGLMCNLCDLRPSTPYLVCVESVVDEKVCHVASRDLCTGIITKPEEMSSPDPQTMILFFSGINALAILTVLALFVHMGRILKKKMQADALSLLYSRDKSISCAMCAGIAISDRNSGLNTTSSNTGTYQQSDAIDAIDLPAH